MFNANDFFSVLKPMFYVSKVLGLAPFSIGPKCYTKSRKQICCSIAVMLFILITTTTSLSTRPELDAGLIAKLTEALDTSCGVTAMCCGILFECLFVDEILRSIQAIDTFDRNIQTYIHSALENEYRKGKIYVSIALSIIILVVAGSASFAIKSTVNVYSFEFIGEFVLYAGPLMISSFISFQFCVLLLCLKRRFEWMNQIIDKVSKNLECSYYGCSNVVCFNMQENIRPATHIVTTGLMQDKALSTFEEIRDRHHQLYAICKTVNKCYSLQILFIVVQNFVTTILALFFCGKYVATFDNVSMEYILYTMNQVALALIQIMSIVAACSSTSSEARKTAYLIHKAITIQDPCKEELQLQVSFFSLQLLHQNVEFTACRIFVLDETLLLSIVGAITTYLVIVIQFEI